VVKYQLAHRRPRAIKFNPHHLILWSFLGLSQWVYVSDDMSKGLKIMSLTVCPFLYCIYVIVDQIIRKEGWDPLHRFNPAIFLCLSKPGTGFPMPYVVWLYLFFFVDISGIVYNHCLKCLFIYTFFCTYILLINPPLTSMNRTTYLYASDKSTANLCAVGS
jgi:hypothetical protein